jgi:hypothetical protein
MIRVSLEEASLLLTDWKERGVWIGAWLVLREDAREEHKFWARVADLTEEKLVLAGHNALVELPFEPGVVCEYSEVTEAPAHLRERFSAYEFCFTIRSQTVLALLFGERPKTEQKSL